MKKIFVLTLSLIMALQTMVFADSWSTTISPEDSKRIHEMGNWMND